MAKLLKGRVRVRGRVGRSRVRALYKRTLRVGQGKPFEVSVIQNNMQYYVNLRNKSHFYALY